MPPSSPVPSGCKPTSSFGSVDWLSQSSHVERSHTSRPAEDSQENFSAQARGSSRGEPPQTQGEEEVKFSEVSAPGTPTAGRSGWGVSLPRSGQDLEGSGGGGILTRAGVWGSWPLCK